MCPAGERGCRRRVVVLDNLSSGFRENLAGCGVVHRDVRDAAAVRQAMAGCDTVFHLAASVGNARSIDDPIQDSEINVLGTLRVLESARQPASANSSISSSAGIFGELKTLPIREDHPVEPDTPYGASKLGGEKLCLAYAKLYPIECVCLRYFNVYGVNQRYDAYGNVIPIFAHRALNGEPFTIYGDGEQTRDFVNVRDVARANLRAAGAGRVRGLQRRERHADHHQSARRAGHRRERACAPSQYAAPRKATCATVWRTSPRLQRAFGYSPRPARRGTYGVHGLGQARAGRCPLTAAFGAVHVVLLSLVFRPDYVSTAHVDGGSGRRTGELGDHVTVFTTTPHYNRDRRGRRASPPSGLGTAAQSDYRGSGYHA